MKAITLTQPWATLVAIGAKQIEKMKAGAMLINNARGTVVPGHLVRPAFVPDRPRVHNRALYSSGAVRRCCRSR